MRFTETQPLRLVMLISGSGSTLANIIAHIDDKRLQRVRLVGVISSRETVPGVEIARRSDLPCEIVRLRDFTDANAFSAALTAACDAFAPDLVAMGGFLRHWGLPDAYANRVINVHPSLLPKFGGRGMFGLHVHAAVLAAGERESGCSVHVVDGEYDHGRVVAQQRVPVLPDDTPETLATRVQAAERQLYPTVIQRVADEGVAWLQH